MLTEDCLSNAILFLNCVDPNLLEDAIVVIDNEQHHHTIPSPKRNFLKVLRRARRIQWDALQEMDNTDSRNAIMTNQIVSSLTSSSQKFRDIQCTNVGCCREKIFMPMYDDEDSPGKKTSLAVSRILRRDYG